MNEKKWKKAIVRPDELHDYLNRLDTAGITKSEDIKIVFSGDLSYYVFYYSDIEIGKA